MNRFGIDDLGVGIGLRPVHFGPILSGSPEIDWFEVLSENYLDTGGRPLYMLDQVVERYPVALHGVSLSVGSTDPLDREYIRGGATSRSSTTFFSGTSSCQTRGSTGRATRRPALT